MISYELIFIRILPCVSCVIISSLYLLPTLIYIIIEIATSYAVEKDLRVTGISNVTNYDTLLRRALQTTFSLSHVRRFFFEAIHKAYLDSERSRGGG